MYHLIRGLHSYLREKLLQEYLFPVNYNGYNGNMPATLARVRTTIKRSIKPPSRYTDGKRLTEIKTDPTPGCTIDPVKIGNATVYNQDCLTIFKDLTDNSVDLIVTDPPYFLDGMDNNWSDTKLKKKKDKSHVIGGLPVGMKFDPKQGIRLQEFFFKVSEEALRVLKPGGFMIAFSQGRLFHRLAIGAEDVGFEIRDMLMWEHNGGQGKAFTQDHFVKKMKMSGVKKQELITILQGRKTPQLRPKFEAILLAQKPKEGTHINNWLKWKTGLIKTDFEVSQTTVFNFEKPHREKTIDHMTVKPLGLMEQIIEVFSIEGQVVLDPFLGSGTTGVAALNKNRKFIGFEIEKRYFDMSVARLSKHG